MEKDFYTVREIQKKWGVSRQAVHQYLRRNVVRTTKLGMLVTIKKSVINQIKK